MKMLVMIVAGMIGFVAAFSFTASDEIGAEVDRRLDEDFVPQCVARARFPAELEAKAPAICGCMKREFDNRGFKLTDAFGAKQAEMQEITQACAQVYG
ncbi:hypothetical protein [Croceicoccus sp. Ery5]|jgi:hypothetical protein|uniref:hypothetical protein n=1 Tax=Croceicoccus sp. Ery5 TaxID=1703340 RepID=UPI001E3002DD|nr:hypothetical protein [Croceicoccus sp. Ery5]